MKLVFMGTSEFAVRSLEACTQLGEVALVVTQPDRRRGRGQKSAPPPVKAWGGEHGLSLVQPERLVGTDFHSELERIAPDVVVVAAYGVLLPPALLAIPRRGCVNVHASLLPRHRGGAPVAWAMIHGDAATGISLMRMDEGLDTGPVIAQRSIAVAPDETGGTLTDKLARLGAAVLRDELPRYLAGDLTAVPQDPTKATAAPRIDKKDARLDFVRPAAELERRVRAFDPAPGAFTTIAGAPHRIWRAAVVEGTAEPGVVLRTDVDGILVGTGRDALAIRELTPPGRRRMTAAEFLAGRRLLPGARLGT